jgi:hypothetical protein
MDLEWQCQFSSCTCLFGAAQEKGHDFFWVATDKYNKGLTYFLSVALKYDFLLIN